MHSFYVRADGGRGVVIDGGIVRSDPRGFRECCAVVHDICSLLSNEANEVMHRSHFSVRDLEEEGRDDLLDSCEAGVGRFPVNWLKLIEQMSEFCHDLLMHHCVRRWRAHRLWGQMPPSLGSYRFIDK